MGYTNSIGTRILSCLNTGKVPESGNGYPVGYKTIVGVSGCNVINCPNIGGNSAQKESLILHRAGNIARGFGPGQYYIKKCKKVLTKDPDSGIIVMFASRRTNRTAKADLTSCGAETYCVRTVTAA